MRWLLPLSLAVGLLSTPVGAQAPGPRGTAAQRGRSAPRSHIVQPGDTIQVLARRFGLTPEALMEANGLRRPRIRPGDSLRIPRAEPPHRRVPASRYTVRQGDSLARIARRHRVSVEDIQAANELRRTTLRPGEQLWVPHQGHSGAEIRERLRTGNPVVAPDVPPELDADEDTATRARVAELGLGTLAVGQRLLHQPPDPRWVEAAGDPEALEGTLLQPVTEGRFLRGWGSGAEGYHLAIDIGAASGTPIHAAERGLVAYVGHGIRGYGNLVILVHANGWVTAYAHNRQNMVVAGQIVERGQLLGTVGETGFAQGPHLHFFFVHDGRHCDPMPLFRPRLERANDDGLELVWDAELRPSAIRCLYRAEAPHPHRHWRDGRARPRPRRR